MGCEPLASHDRLRHSGSRPVSALHRGAQYRARSGRPSRHRGCPRPIPELNQSPGSRLCGRVSHRRKNLSSSRHIMNFLQFMLQNSGQVLEQTLEHLWLVGVSTVLAVLIGIPLGILITRLPKLNKPVLGAANVIQTIPSLALFGFLLPAPWIGTRADRLAILALTLYALLPMIRSEEHTSELQSRVDIVCR